MFNKKIEIDPSLYDALHRTAIAHGYSDADELIRHVLELIASGDASDRSDDATIRDRLKGLGYLE